MKKLAVPHSRQKPVKTASDARVRLSCQKHDGAAQTQDEQVVYDVALWDGEDAVVPRQLEEQEA